MPRYRNEYIYQTISPVSFQHSQNIHRITCNTKPGAIDQHSAYVFIYRHIEVFNWHDANIKQTSSDIVSACSRCNLCQKSQILHIPDRCSIGCLKWAHDTKLLWMQFVWSSNFDASIKGHVNTPQMRHETYITDSRKILYLSQLWILFINNTPHSLQRFGKCLCNEEIWNQFINIMFSNKIFIILFLIP